MVRFYFDWDWRGAEAEFKRAIKLDPSSVAARVDYATYLFSILRIDESLAQSAAAARLDPLSMRPVHDMGIAYLVKGDLEQASAKFREGIAINPRWIWGFTKLARTLAMQGKCSEAMAQAEVSERGIAGGAAPLSRAWLAVTYATCKQPALARQKIAELHDLERTQYIDPFNFVDIYAALGEIDLAVQLAERAYEDRSPQMAYFLIAKTLYPMLSEQPRFRALEERLQFPPPGG
jgi:hypothetical protein